MDYLRISKYIIAGGITTSIHLGVVMALVNLNICGVEISNGIAYMLSTIFNLTVNTTWSFKETVSRKIIQRYMVVSAIGLILAMLVAYYNDKYGYHYMIGIGIIVCICPAVTYFMHVKYTYK